MTFEKPDIALIRLAFDFLIKYMLITTKENRRDIGNE